MIKARETEYNGHRFRSRLEARWAVFFDALGVEYEYEPEGFVLPSGRTYLPDFAIECHGVRGRFDANTHFDLYIEVKGVMSESDASKVREFAMNGNSILVVGNIPKVGMSTDGESLGAYEGMDGTDVCPFNYELIDGDYFAAYPAAHDGMFYLFGGDSNYINEADKQVVELAYDKARKARFEWGERCG